MPQPNRKLVLRRENSEPSPKVAVPSGLLLVAAVVWSLIKGVEVDPEQITLAVAAVVTFIAGYFKHDTVDQADLIDTLNYPEEA